MNLNEIQYSVYNIYCKCSKAFDSCPLEYTVTSPAIIFRALDLEETAGVKYSQSFIKQNINIVKYTVSYICI